jgi:hypothetical protein
MKYRIRNKKGEFLNLYDLSTNITLEYSEVTFLGSIASVRKKNKVAERYDGYGGELKSSGKFAEREINFSFKIVSENIVINNVHVGKLEHRKILNYISKFFRPENRDFWLEDMIMGIETKITDDGIKPKTKEGLEFIISDGEISLTLIDGLWLGNEVTINGTFADTGVVEINTDDQTVNMMAISFDAFPRIELTSKGNNPDFTLFNEANNYSIRVKEIAFTANEKITLDSTGNGGIYFNQTSKKKMVVDGYLLFFSPGVNRIFYAGFAGVDYVIKFRPRFVF